MKSSLGYNYLGTLDDSVERFPWPFKVTAKRLDHSLAIQLITGRPILLNDGYLIQHSLCVKAITDRDSLLWALIDSGFVSIMSRGFGEYPLQEMPERMSQSVDTMRALVNDDLPGVPPWEVYKRKLADIDARMRAIDNFIRWPKYDAGSGFSVLTDRLLERGSSPKSLGISSFSSEAVLDSFLKDFQELMSDDLSGARTQWERLSKSYADNPDNTKSPKKAHRELMALANEIYHYNIGIMLSGDIGCPISVETQVSSAFDDLLVVEDVILEDVPNYPKLNVPIVVTTASPQKLAQILDPDRPVGEARLRWLNAEQQAKDGEFEDRRILQEIANEYAQRLSEHLGVSVSYKESEGLMSFVAAKALSTPREAMLVGTGAAAGALGAQLGLPIALAGIGGVAAGYAVSKIQKNMLGAVTKKVRIRVLEGQISRGSTYKRMMDTSEATIRSIMNRKIPSAVDMDTVQARRLLSKYRVFGE